MNLPKLELGPGSIGQRLSGVRRERGYTQVELAEKIGILQNLVSAYERDQLRLNAEMLARFAMALEVSSDQLLGLKTPPNGGPKPSLKILRRLKRIETLPITQQKTLFKTIDTFLKAAGM
ncbi:MAG: helix-turn-helix transcriptional regulator [Pseudomonadota bacterium]